jgi:formylglycine-generating enzyme required for sulfatase activity
LFACGDSTSGPENNLVASVEITPPGGMLYVGVSLQLSATARDEDGVELSDRPLSWSSSNEQVATVDDSGLVTGVAEGTVTITVTCESESHSATFTIETPPLGIGFGPKQFALIEAGTFQMGDQSGIGDQDELPVHAVTITQPFEMQITELTQAQWSAVMGSNPASFQDCGNTCPVEMVSRDDVQLFLAALNQMDPGKNYRLPTEAEWEYACRAGTTGDFGGSGVMDEMGWYGDNSGETPHPVAQKSPNAWGLYDMHGNLYEWVQDWYSSTYYEESPTEDPQGPATGEYTPTRGGSWDGVEWSARSAARWYVFPTSSFDELGFRLVRDPQGAGS